MRYHLTEKSSNRKTGDIAVSTTSADSCPVSCPARKSFCYAEKAPLRFHWNALSAGRRGMNFRAFTAAIRALPAGSMFRHNQAGDLPGRSERVDSRALRALKDSTRHLIAWTYTHKRDWKALRRENGRLGMVINLSANSVAHADTLIRRNAGPVTAIVPKDTRPGSYTPAGNLIAICPAQLSERVTCKNCGNGRPLCARPVRGYIIGFRKH